MKKSAIAITAALCLSATTALAGPKSFITGESGTTEAGRAYNSKIVTCSGKAADPSVFYFKDIKRWCLKDESYCNRNIVKTAKKACKKSK